MKKLVWVMVALILLLLAGVTVLPYVFALEGVKNRLLVLARDGLGREVRLDKVRLAIWTGLGLRLEKLVILEDPKLGRGPFVTADNVDVTVHFWPLLRGQVELDRITLRQPTVRLVRSKDGRLNVSTLGGHAPAENTPTPEQPPAAVGLPFRIDRFSIERGQVEFQDQSTEATQTVEDLSFSVTGIGLGRIVELRGTAVLQPGRIPLRFSGRVGPLTEELRPETIAADLRLGSSDVRVEGGFKEGQLVLLMRSDRIEVDPLLAFFMPPGEKAAKPGPPGREDSSGTAPSTFRARADLQLKQVAAYGVAVSDVTGKAEYDGRDVKVRPLHLKIYGGDATLNGTLDLTGRKMPFQGDLGVSGVQIGPALSQFTKLGRIASGTIELSASGKGEAGAPSILSALTGKGKFELRGGALEGVDIIGDTIAALKGEKKGPTVAASDRRTVVQEARASFGIDLGKVRLSDLRVESSGFVLKGGGTLGLDGKVEMAADLLLSPELTQQLAQKGVARLLKTEGNRMVVPVRLVGAFPTPMVEVDTRALAGRGKEQLQKRFGEELKKRAGPEGENLRRLFGR